MLYNTHLETLIRVVEAGSFRGAAEQIGISPSAVLKQITLLEQDLKVSVFDRSRRGVSLTEAGESVYRDAKYIVRYCGTATEKAQELYEKQAHYVRLGVSIINPGKEMLQLQPKLLEICPDIRFRFVPFENSFTGMEQAYVTIGQDTDVIVGIYDERFLDRFGLEAVPFRKIVPQIAASPDHIVPGSAEQPASLEDLNGRTLMLPEEGISMAADALRKRILSDFPSIHIEDIGMYSLDLYYECQNSDKCLYSYKTWAMSELLLHYTPMDWDYSSSYGLMFSREPSLNTARLVEAVRKVLDEKGLAEQN